MKLLYSVLSSRLKQKLLAARLRFLFSERWKGDSMTQRVREAIPYTRDPKAVIWESLSAQIYGIYLNPTQYTYVDILND